MKKLAIKPGDKFKKLTVIKATDKRIAGSIVYECQCECGNDIVVSATHLQNGRVKTCKRCYDVVVGDKYEKLTVINEVKGKSPDENSSYECRCECGATTIVQANRLKPNPKTNCEDCGDISPGDRFGQFTVINISSKQKWDKLSYECQCDCGKHTDIPASRLKSGRSALCSGCTPIVVGNKCNKLTIIKMMDKGTPNDVTKYECLCDCGNTVVVRRGDIKSNNTKSCRKCSIVSVGERFGKLTVFDVSDKQNGGQAICECKCDCGNLKSVSAYQLRVVGTRSCGCLKKHDDRSRALRHRTYSRAIVHASKMLNMDYDISFDEFNELIDQKCFYCGAVGANLISDTRNGERVSDTNLYCNGIDRIDNNKGYLKENTVACCIKCNASKSNTPQAKFKEWARSAHEFYNHPDIDSKRTDVPYPRINITARVGKKLEDRHSAIVKNIYNQSVTTRSRRHKIDTNVSIEEFNKLIHQPCHYCGIKGSKKTFDTSVNNKKNNHSSKPDMVCHNGIDRIDNNQGYVPGNMVACCWDCNRAKAKDTQLEFKKWLEQLYNVFVIEKTPTEDSTLKQFVE